MLLIALLTIAGQTEAPSTKSKSDAGSERLISFYQSEASAYKIHRDAERRQALEFRKEPVYIWVNPARTNGQHGAVFLWLWKGRPEVFGCVFSHPVPLGRKVNHEFHTLATGVLHVERPGPFRWEPQAGLDRNPVPGAPTPAATASQRLLQIRNMAREFSGHSVDYSNRRWELRLLPQPLFRYSSEDAGITDGAILTFVSNAGTDPEVLLVLEAHKAGDAPRWEYALARYSDWSLYMQHKGREVWSAVRDAKNTLFRDELEKYRLIEDKIVDSDSKFVRWSKPGDEGKPNPREGAEQ
jgi:hypothetical protein